MTQNLCCCTWEWVFFHKILWNLPFQTLMLRNGSAPLACYVGCVVNEAGALAWHHTQQHNLQGIWPFHMVRNAMSGWPSSLYYKKCLVMDFLLSGSWGHQRYTTQRLLASWVWEHQLGPSSSLGPSWVEFLKAISSSFVHWLPCRLSKWRRLCHVYSLTYSLCTSPHSVTWNLRA